MNLLNADDWKRIGQLVRDASVGTPISLDDVTKTRCLLHRALVLFDTATLKELDDDPPVQEGKAATAV